MTVDNSSTHLHLTLTVEERRAQMCLFVHCFSIVFLLDDVRCFTAPVCMRACGRACVGVSGVRTFLPAGARRPSGKHLLFF